MFSLVIMTEPYASHDASEIERMLFLLACMVVKYGVLVSCRQAGNSRSSPLSTLHLHFLKGKLGVKQSTTNWAVLRECGHEPLQFYWFRSAVKLFNSMLNTNSDILRRVVQADLNLQPRSSACLLDSSIAERFSGTAWV